MRLTFALLTLAGICSVSAGAQAPVAARANAQPPSTLEGAREWSAAIARHANELLVSPAMWDRSDTTGVCPTTLKPLSIRCALERAADEAVHASRDAARPATSGARVQCKLRREQGHEEGSCGAILGELPVLVVERVPRITTGALRTDAQPSDVWAGTMVDASQPVLQVARQTVSEVSTRQYAARLIGFNNDPSTTFADVQRFFRIVEERLAHAQPSAFMQSGDSIEIEVYTGGHGVIRTVEGWFPVSDFDARDSTVRFAIDTTSEVAASALDRRIIERADAILASDSVWNRADNRECASGATTWSVYCALERATIEVTGGFHHRRPALEVVRQIVEDRTKGRNYAHRLMDYNNDPSTHLGDVRSLFAEALAHVKDK